MKELETATSGFAPETLLGKGSHGCVFKGRLKNGKVVAIKRRTAGRKLLEDETSFTNELEILSKIQSDRLVNLLGFSRDSDEKLLVVEYMSNGTLHDILHKTPMSLSWSMRVLLSIQVAKAVSTLHYASPPIIHRDIKSSNVLIDGNWNAKLGDFGLALRGNAEDMCMNAVPPAGTMGYLDPEYETPADLSTKTDVFSFGILLLEIISGRKAIDVAYDPPSILEWAVPLIKQGNQCFVCDSKFRLPLDFKPLKKFVNLAAKCVRTSSYRRPSMLEVEEDLREISKRISSPMFDGLSLVVKRSLNTQKPKLGLPSRLSARALTEANAPRQLSAVLEVPEEDAMVSDIEDKPVVEICNVLVEEEGVTDEELVMSYSPGESSSPFCTPDTTPSYPLTPASSEGEESDTTFEDFGSACGSFSSGSMAIDADEDSSEDDVCSNGQKGTPSLSLRETQWTSRKPSSPSPPSPLLTPGRAAIPLEVGDSCRDV